MKVQGSYTQMLNYARETEQAGTIDIVSLGGLGGQNTYKFSPSAGGKSKHSKHTAAADNLIRSLQASEASAKKANAERYKQAMSKMLAIESIYSPGGSFGKGYAAYLSGQTEDILASQEQGLVSSGLWSTTKKEGLKTVAGKREAEAMGEFQRKQMGGYAQALAGTAGLIERREDTSMDYGLIAQLMAKATA